MFFNDIASWSKTKLRAYWISFNVVYFIASILIPIIIVGCRYEIFKKSSAYRLTGWGIVLIIIIVVVAIKIINKMLNKLPESTLAEQRVKYTALGVKSLILPIFVLVVMLMFKKNFDLAFNTCLWCVISFIAGILVDMFFIKYLDRELDLRNKAKEQNEINKRVENLKG